MKQLFFDINLLTSKNSNKKTKSDSKKQMSKAQVTEQLTRIHPQFKDKQKLIDYYMNFEFPEKQRSSSLFWQNVLQSYLVIRKKLTFSLEQLEDFFHMHGLKPLPLKNLLRFFIDKGTFEWTQKTIKAQVKKSWWNAMIGIMWKAQQNYNEVERNPQKKIFITCLVQKKMRQMKQFIPQIFQKYNVIDGNFFVKEAEKALNLNHDLILITNRLSEQGFLKQQQLPNGQFVFIFTNDPKNMNSQIWRTTKRTKYIIQNKISEFEDKITEKCTIQDNLVTQAKEYLERNDRKKAKMVLLNAKVYEKQIQTWNIRKQALIDSLHQIQLNEINNISVDILKISQQVIKETAIDSSDVQDVIQKNREIKFQQNRIDDQFKEVAQMDNDENQVEEMMKEIQNEVTKQKNSVSKERLIRPQFKNKNMEIQQPVNGNRQQSFGKKQENGLLNYG